MKKLKLSLTILSLLACSTGSFPAFAGAGHQGEHEDHHKEEVVKGPNNGRILVDGDFAIELQLFENGLPPEFRIFATKSGQKIPASELDVSMQLVRLGNQVDDINFAAMGEFLRGDTVIYEPHSFVVKLAATYQGKTYQWQYDNFEGRTKIVDVMANEMAIKTEQVAAQTLVNTTAVYGQLVLPESATRHISAPYPGKVTELNVELGQKVQKGALLMHIKSNDSLQSYAIYSPISGVVTEQSIATGEQAFEQNLLTIVNTEELHAELKAFPNQQQQIQLGAKVELTVNGSDKTVSGNIYDQLFSVDAQQASTFRVKVNNAETKFRPGQFVNAQVELKQFVAPMAVKASGLQPFRDFTVVYAKIGEQYEVRMLELGRQAGEWVEVLSGIELGTEYVTDNSYIIKADIEKSGASHDH